MKRLLLVLSAALAQVARLFRRTTLKVQGRLAETSTMADYAKILAIPDDKGPALRRPDPNAPHAELINRVRLYAQSGAKALGPLLDVPLPVLSDCDEWKFFRTDDEWEAYRAREPERVDWDDALFSRYQDVREAFHESTDAEGAYLLKAFICRQEDGALDWNRDAFYAAHAAYNSPWTVKDGEVWEVVTDAKATH